MSMISRLGKHQSLYLSAILAAFSLVSMFAFVSVVASGADPRGSTTVPIRLTADAAYNLNPAGYALSILRAVRCSLGCTRYTADLIVGPGQSGVRKYGPFEVDGCDAIDPSGHSFAFCGPSGRLSVVDLKTGRTHVIEPSDADSVSFSPDGRFLALVTPVTFGRLMIYDLAHGTLVPAGGTSVIGNSYSWAHHSDELEGLVDTGRHAGEIGIVRGPSPSFVRYIHLLYRRYSGSPGWAWNDRSVLYFVSGNGVTRLIDLSTHSDLTHVLVDGFRGPTCGRARDCLYEPPAALPHAILAAAPTIGSAFGVVRGHHIVGVSVPKHPAATGSVVPGPSSLPFLVSWSGGIANCARARCLNSRMGIGIWRPGGRKVRVIASGLDGRWTRRWG